jgi:predicted nucleotidyltransferase
MDIMSTRPARPGRAPSRPRAPITQAAIRRYALQIAEHFQPERIILFGSYAYGQPHADSDVDLLVVMPAADMVNQAVRITMACDPPFPLDLLVRTPRYLQQRIEDEDWFLREIVSRGKILYEKADQRVGPKGRGRLARREDTGQLRSDRS